ncbi:MAG TPA: response regulator transcription factor [Anaeromyxobacteraceae bacterium]|nr:response regulator transcription factor [Anaeromyxobacteraceae bacterium]
MAEKILVVEDDPSILRGLQLNLGMEGYAVRSAMDGETGLSMARTEKPDLILLDVGLPRLSGLDFIRALRAEDPEVPILVVSAKGQEADKVTGLSLGADDYVVKPFALKELLARIAAALRRRRRRGETGVQRNLKKAGKVVLDLDAHRATVEGEELELTGREFDLLAYFVSHPGRVYTREQLTQAVWGQGYSGTGRTVDNFVVRLRQHIGDDAEHPRHLETVRGLGYRFTP